MDNNESGSNVEPGSSDDEELMQIDLTKLGAEIVT